MNFKGAKKILMATAAVSAIGLSASNLLAQQDAVQIFSDATDASVQYGGTGDPVADPIVTAILSVPGVTVNGYSYSATGGTFLAADSTGSLELYGTPSGTYSPTVGDSLVVTGEYDPFDEIPEIKVSSGTVAVQSTGNASPAGAGTFSSPLGVSVSTINTGTVSQQYGAQLLELSDATISGAAAGTTFGTGDESYTIADATGSMTLFYYPHDFSVANQNMYGETVDQSGLSVIGIVDSFDGSSEFIPLEIVPEPGVISLFGIGSIVSGLFCYRLRRKV